MDAQQFYKDLNKQERERKRLEAIARAREAVEKACH